MITDNECNGCIYDNGSGSCCFSWCIREESDDYSFDIPGNYKNY